MPLLIIFTISVIRPSRIFRNFQKYILRKSAEFLEKEGKIPLKIG